MTTKDVQATLRSLGWPLNVDGRKGPVTVTAIKDFQRGFAFKRFGRLSVDGRVGPRTVAALRFSKKRKGRCSANFYFREFKSKGNGWIRVQRDLVLGLEAYRKALGRSVSVVSAYRDPAHNAKVGGAKNSQHLYGNACDLNPALPSGRVKALGKFSGIGVQRANGLTRHVDVRHRGPSNTTRGTTRNPTVWWYG